MTLAIASPELPKIGALDALRGFAISGVMLVHTGKQLHNLPEHVGGVCNWGQFGVQLFFISSAFTLAMSVDRRGSAWKAFFIRRFFRIAPMFWLAVALYGIALVGLLPVADDNRDSSWIDLVRTAFFANGWTKSSINSVVPGSWSIAAEWSFYLVFPLVFPFLNSVKRAWWGCVIAVVFAILAQGAAWLFLHHVDEPAFAIDPNPYNFFFRLWFPAQALPFMTGIYLYRIGQNWRAHLPSIVSLMVAIAVLVGIGHEVVGLQHKVFLFTLLFIPFVLWVINSQNKFLAHPIWRSLGKVSFSAYLLHFMILDLLVMWSPITGWPWPVALPSLFVATALATYSISWVTYHAIELPGISLGRSLIRRLNQ